MITTIVFALCTLTLQAQTPDSTARGFGDDIRQPSVIFKVDPEYSTPALAAHLEGFVMLRVIVGADGQAHDIQVVKSLGLGLDEKAIEAVRQWKFNPGMKDGQPVNVRANIQVNFKFAKSRMILNNSIGNDPAKEKLCIERVNMPLHKIVPFYIDTSYIASVRAQYPDVVFIALDNATLVECFRNSGSAEYGPGVMSGESWFFHLIKPKQFQPGINTQQGDVMAGDACREAARVKINRPNFDHSVVFGPPKEIIGDRVSIAGKTAENYDILINGKAFYKLPGPDLAEVNFRCLFSPMLDVKAIELK